VCVCVRTLKRESGKQRNFIKHIIRGDYYLPPVLNHPKQYG